MPCSSAEHLVLRLQDMLMHHIVQQLQNCGQVESDLLQLSNLLAGVSRELQEQQQQS
jgi:hypothetical protein